MRDLSVEHLGGLLDQLREFDLQVHRLGLAEQTAAIASAEQALGWFAGAADRAHDELPDSARDNLLSENLAQLAHAVALVGARLDAEDSPGLAAMAWVEAANAGAWLSGFNGCLRITGAQPSLGGNP